MADSALITWLHEHLAQPGLLTLALLLVCLPYHWWAAAKRRRRDLRQWQGQQFMHRHPRRGVARSAAWLAVLCLVAASAGPLWGTNPHVAEFMGRDLFLVLDVSRSMLAEDRPPANRLDRAKARIRELLDYLQGRGGGHRLGLIVFAGQARLVCPLTADYDHLRYMVALAHPDQLGPQTRLSPQEPQVGTSFRPTVELAVQQAQQEDRPGAAFLLITDGDDLAQDAEAAALCMRDSPGRWHLFGVGEPSKPTWIPSGNPAAPFVLLGSENLTAERATTQRRDELLLGMAATAKAPLLLENAELLPLVNWWQRELAGGSSSTWLSDPRSLRTHQYGWFLVAAFVFLVLEWVWGEGRFRRET